VRFSPGGGANSPCYNLSALGERPGDGAVQWFEGGAMLLLPAPEGGGTILVLSEPDHRWQELPDTP